MPLGNALILSLYEGQERANMLGLSGVVMNLGGIALQLLGGILAAIRWNYAFLSASSRNNITHYGAIHAP
jgi:MFS family permease